MLPKIPFFILPVFPLNNWAFQDYDRIAIGRTALIPNSRGLRPTDRD